MAVGTEMGKAIARMDGGQSVKCDRCEYDKNDVSTEYVNVLEQQGWRLIRAKLCGACLLATKEEEAYAHSARHRFAGPFKAVDVWIELNDGKP